MSAFSPKAGNVWVTLIVALGKQVTLVFAPRSEASGSALLLSPSASRPMHVEALATRRDIRATFQSVRDEIQMNAAALFACMPTTAAGFGFIASCRRLGQEV
jgi:hypothetical protein